MATPTEHLPNRIRELREAKGWSQSDLGDRMGIDYSTVGRLETGTRALTMAWMRRLAKSLGCAVGDLLLKTDNPGDLSADEAHLLALIREGGPSATRMVIGLARVALSRDADDAATNPRRA